MTLVKWSHSLIWTRHEPAAALKPTGDQEGSTASVVPEGNSLALLVMFLGIRSPRPLHIFVLFIEIHAPQWLVCHRLEDLCDGLLRLCAHTCCGSLQVGLPSSDHLSALRKMSLRCSNAHGALTRLCLNNNASVLTFAPWMLG